MIMNDTTTTIKTIKDAVETFVINREWHQFHNAKNSSMAITIEAAELMEIFQWAKPEDIASIMQQKREAVEDELVDIVWMVLALCNRYDIDFTTAFNRKLKKNEAKYPVEKSKGLAKKYTEL